MKNETIGWIVMELKTCEEMYAHAWRLRDRDNLLELIRQLNGDSDLTGWTVYRTKKQAAGAVHRLRQEYKDNGVYAF